MIDTCVYDEHGAPLTQAELDRIDAQNAGMVAAERQAQHERRESSLTVIRDAAHRLAKAGLVRGGRGFSASWDADDFLLKLRFQDVYGSD